MPLIEELPDDAPPQQPLMEQPLIEEIPDDEVELEGHRVELQGLKAKPELNGQLGTTLTWASEAQRMGVKLDDGSLLRVKMANLRILEQKELKKEADAPELHQAITAATPQPPVPTPSTSPGQELDALIYVSLRGQELDALRAALQQHGLTEQVTTGPKGPGQMESASIEQLVRVTHVDVGGRDTAVCSQALGALANVVPNQSRDARVFEAATRAATAAMALHADNVDVQAAGAKLLSALVGAGDKAASTVLTMGGVDACMVALQSRHKAHEKLMAEVFGMLSLLTGGDDVDSNQPRFGYLPSVPGVRGVWARIDTLGGTATFLPALLAALGAHPSAGELQSSGCRVLAHVAMVSSEHQQAVCNAGGARAAVHVLEELSDNTAARSAAIFLLANLASGEDACKEAVGAAGAPDALARAVRKYRARADVLRLTIGALTQLAQVDAGRRHVITSDATAAIVLAMRAQASDPVVFDEGCYFLAALAYGGPAGRRAALEAGADQLLHNSIRRFGNKPGHKRTIEMATTIHHQLLKGRAERATQEEGELV